MPEISIIVPVYKVEKYLDRCVKSILAQTFTDFELILVDDGSPDNCPQMCDEWAKKDERIRVIHKENGGLSSARNAGLRVAVGNYIGFVDSDDWITKDMYEHLYSLIIKNKMDISMCCFARNPKKLEEGLCEKGSMYFDKKKLMEFFFRVNGELSNYAVWNRLYKKELLNDIRFVEGRINEDVLFSYEVFRKANGMIFSKQRKYLYFQNRQGITNGKLRKKDFDLLKNWDFIVENEKENVNYEWAKINRMRATYTLYVKARLYGYEKDIEKKILEDWREELKENYRELMNTKFFDWKRKILLFCIAKL